MKEGVKSVEREKPEKVAKLALRLIAQGLISLLLICPPLILIITNA